MKKFLIVLLCLGLVGCATIQHQTNLDSVSFYITVQRGYPSVKAVSFYNSDIDYGPIDKRIDEYLNNHPTTDSEIAKKMRNYIIFKGMTKEQVLAITGKNPDNKDYNQQINEERWIYGSILMKGRVVIITFKNDRIEKIDDKWWDSCPQCS